MKPQARARDRRSLRRLGDETNKGRYLRHVVFGCALLALLAIGMVSLFELFVGF